MRIRTCHCKKAQARGSKLGLGAGHRYTQQSTGIRFRSEFFTQTHALRVPQKEVSPGSSCRHPQNAIEAGSEGAEALQVSEAGEAFEDIGEGFV